MGGPKLITQIPRNQIQIANEYELKYNVLCHETRFSNDNQLELPVFDSQNADEMAVYDFLGDVGNFYIDRFLQNGYTALHFVLIMEKENLQQMNLKMAHINYIWHKLQTFDEDTFNALRMNKIAKREQIKQEIEAERLQKIEVEKQEQIEQEKREQIERERLQKIENEKIAQREAERLRKEQIEKDRLEKMGQQRIEEQKENEFNLIKQHQAKQKKEKEENNNLVVPVSNIDVRVDNITRSVGTGNYPSSPSSVSSSNSDSDDDILQNDGFEETKGGPNDIDIDENDEDKDKNEEAVQENDDEKICDYRHNAEKNCTEFLVEDKEGTTSWKSRAEVQDFAFYR